MTNFHEASKSYDGWWDRATPRDDARHRVGRAVDRALSNRLEIEPLSEELSIPWALLAALQELEATGRMDRHICNGEPLTHRTRLVPAGEPPEGNPPWTWTDAARQELRKLWRPSNNVWTTNGILWAAELWNGLGYRAKKIPSPYLVAGCEIEHRGKYVADHVFDPEAWSDQVGALVLLRALSDAGEWSRPDR